MSEITFDYIRKLKRGTSSFDIYSFPYLPEVTISVRVLTQLELMDSQDIGRVKAKELLKEPSQNDVNDFIGAEILFRCIYTSGEEKKPFFESPEQVLELSKDETNHLFEYYSEVQEKYSPLSKVNTQADFDNLVEEVSKKSVLGMSLSSYTLKQLVWYLIENGKTLPSDSDSISSPAKKQDSTNFRQPRADSNLIDE